MPKHLPYIPVAVLLAIAGGPLRSQTPDPLQMEPVVATATLLPQSTATLGTEVATISGSDVDRLQMTSLADLLGTLADVPVFAAGQTGAAASVFMRGADSDQTLVLVDGIRFNDANTDYSPFLAQWRPSAADRLEVAYGPQSVLYGAEAIGGVISLDAKPGTPAATQSVDVESGSFGTVDGSVAAQGSLLGWSYDLAAAGGKTDNARPNNEFDSANVLLRLDRSLTGTLSVGGTLRALDSHYGDPGDIYTDSLTDYEDEKDVLVTAFANDQLSSLFSAHLTVGGLDRELISSDYGELTETTNRRGVLTGQVTGQMTETDKIVAGLDLEDEHTVDTGFGDIDHGQKLLAVFGEDEWEPTNYLYLTGGVRRDDYSTYGGATTGRGTLAWLGPDHMIKLRASYGTGFDSPSFLELYSRDPSFAGNPNLQPERATGWDVGFDAYLAKNQTVSVTAFRTDYRDLIESNFAVYPATSVNIDRARTQGLEISVLTPWAGAIQTKLSYAYLEAADETDQVPLLRRPKQSASADLWLDAGNGWSMGVGGNYVGVRYDIDALTFDTVEDPDYTVVRAYTKWQVNGHLALRARVENALDRTYSPVNGYPALGRGVFASADWVF